MKVLKNLVALCLVITLSSCIKKFETPSQVKFLTDYFNEDSILMNYSRLERQNTKFKTIGNYYIGGQNNLADETDQYIDNLGKFTIKDRKDLDGKSIIMKFEKYITVGESANFNSYILAFTRKYGPYSYYYNRTKNEPVFVWLKDGVQVMLIRNFLNEPEIIYRSLNTLPSLVEPVLDSTMIIKDDQNITQKKIKDSLKSKSTNMVYDNL